jgi:ATP synthase protein I
MNRNRRLREEKNRRFAEEIRRQSEKRIESGREKDYSVWFGLGHFGAIGWSVALPTVMGIAAGIWLDGRMESDVSWTLTLFGGGLFLGLASAWFWLRRERKEIVRERDQRLNRDDSGEDER